MCVKAAGAEVLSLADAPTLDNLLTDLSLTAEEGAFFKERAEYFRAEIARAATRLARRMARQLSPLQLAQG